MPRRPAEPHAPADGAARRGSASSRSRRFGRKVAPLRADADDLRCAGDAFGAREGGSGFAGPRRPFDQGSGAHVAVFRGHREIADIQRAREDPKVCKPAREEASVSCADYETLIALYVENDLTEQEMSRVESHVETCAACSEFVAAMRESQAVLKALRLDRMNDAARSEERRVGKECRTRWWT